MDLDSELLQSSPDPLNEPNGHRLLNPSHKRHNSSQDQLSQSRHQRNPTLFNFKMPVNISESAKRMAMQSAAESEKECIEQARNLVAKASVLAVSTERKTQLLDLLEVFRDFTEKGRVNKHGLSVLANQVSSLETVSKNLGKSVREMHKTAPKQSPAPAPAPPASAPGPAFSARTPAVNGNHPLSYAATAANGPNANWNVIEKKKAQVSKPKHTLSNRQLVLTQEEHQTAAGIDPLAIRNAFNAAFAAKGMSNPVVASVKASKRENIVLTTTPSFNAEYLLEHINIWKHLATFKEALPIQPWFKVAIHGIPTSFHTNADLAILKEEIPTFNNGLKIVGNPYWLTKEEKRSEQLSGSACIAFASEQEAQRAIRGKLYLLGISVRVEKLHSTPASTQCSSCQHFGHEESRCPGTISCRLCAEPHHTKVHSCNVCKTKGRWCKHLVPVCTNCKGAHTADNKQCEAYRATIRNPNKGMDLDNPIDIEC
jgi:hypothetical protein